MKKMWLMTIILGVIALASLTGNVVQYKALNQAKVELLRWEIYSTSTMNEMWGLSYDERYKGPEEELPMEKQERLLALSRRVGERTLRCEGDRGHLEAKLGGYDKPMTSHPGS